MRGDAVVHNADELTRRVALNVVSALSISTPVDTGRARSNWQTSVGEAKTGTLPAPASPGEGAERMTREAQDAVASYPGQLAIHITNNLPYIVPLNQGHSTQQPAGFVERAIASGVNAVRTVKGITGELIIEEF